MQSVTLRRGERRYDVEVGNSQADITAEHLGRMFHINPGDVWLRERFGARLFFPDRNGSFDLTDVTEFTELEVEGDRPSNSIAAGRPSMTVTASAVPVRSYPGFSSVVSHSSTSSRKSSGSTSFTLKIIQARVEEISANGRPTFNKVGQAFVDVEETTANVHYITDMMQEELGPDHVLVTADGLEIKDSSGTQGNCTFQHSCVSVFGGFMGTWN